VTIKEQVISELAQIRQSHDHKIKELEEKLRKSFQMQQVLKNNSSQKYALIEGSDTATERGGESVTQLLYQFFFC
jgi:hypothetical protein